MKTKSLEEVNYIALKDKTLNEIKRDYVIMTILIIISVLLTIIVSVRNIKLAIDYEALNKEKKALEDCIETQSSMIADLEENCRELYIELKERK